MYDVIFSQKSVEDLSNIWRYTANKWSIKQADKYYNILISFCKNIATNPFLYGMKSLINCSELLLKNISFFTKSTTMKLL